MTGSGKDGDRALRGDRGLALRILSAGVLIPLALAITWAGGLVIAGFVGAMALGLLNEWRVLVRHAVGVPELLILMAGAAAVISLAAGGRPDWALLALAVAGTGAGLWGSLHGRDGFYALFGAFYILGPALVFLWMRAGEDGFAWTLWLFSIVWMTDTGAYFAGRVVKGPAFAPLSSPNKTWAGLLGGVILAVATGTLVAHLIFGADEPHQLIWFTALGFQISMATQAGDIFESVLKRHFDAKDTGQLIPGHGGLLDRMDGFLFAAMMLSLALAFR